MPLYEYSCRDCSSQFELLIRQGDKPCCPECDSDKLERLLSVAAAHSAGSRDLPTCRPMPSGGCGLPQCGQGECGLD